MKKYHYVYKLTINNPFDERKFYIGCRSCKCNPRDDVYFSSSKEIKKLIEDNFIFHKEILNIFDTREEAISYEILLHEKFDVSNNNSFFNKSNQTSTGFDTTNYIFIRGQRIRIDDYQNCGLKYHTHGKITVVDENGNYQWVDTDDERYKSGEFKNITKGKMPVYISGVWKNIDVGEYYKNKNKYIASNTSKVPVEDSNGRKFLVNKDDDRYISGELKSVHKGKVLSKDKDGKTFYVSRENFLNSNLFGINKGLICGENNPNSKNIKIYNSENELIFDCKGNFKKICKENKLPFISLYRSYRNGGERIYSTERGRKEALRRDMNQFIGWYAIEVPFDKGK
jgi:hypothetical protein